MEFITNDLSFHGQFHDLAAFQAAINRLMDIRQVISQFGRELYCNKSIGQAQVTSDMTMPQAANRALTREKRNALLQWILRQGPFWDDFRNHQAGDWIEHNGNIVTDSAVGEAGWCCANGIDRRLVSLDPSDWTFSPVAVTLISDTDRITADIVNYWQRDNIEAALRAAPAPIATWDQLAEYSVAQFTQLTFAENAFTPLTGHPYGASAPQRILVILDILNRFKSCFDQHGHRTPEGHKIYQDFFTGKKGEGGRGALFSDSSDREKVQFINEMTFMHPHDATKTLFCPWHGKVQTPQFRVHFSWPIRHDRLLYIVYVGPKITKG